MPTFLLSADELICPQNPVFSICKDVETLGCMGPGYKADIMLCGGLNVSSSTAIACMYLFKFMGTQQWNGHSFISSILYSQNFCQAQLPLYCKNISFAIMVKIVISPVRKNCSWRKFPAIHWCGQLDPCPLSRLLF